MPGGPGLRIELVKTFLSPGSRRVDLGYWLGDRYLQILLWNGGSNADHCGLQVSNDSSFRCKIDGSTMTILDKAGTVINVPAGDNQRQMDLLAGLCTKASTAKCDFTPTRRERTYAQPRAVGTAYFNCTGANSEKTLIIEDKVGVTNSFASEVSTEVESDFIIAKVKASLTLKFSTEWTTERTFREEVHVTALPRRKVWVVAETPVIRDFGDFKLQLGNTTWLLRGVYFDSPDPGRPGFVQGARSGHDGGGMPADR